MTSHSKLLEKLTADAYELSYKYNKRNLKAAMYYSHGQTVAARVLKSNDRLEIN